MQCFDSATKAALGPYAWEQRCQRPPQGKQVFQSKSRSLKPSWEIDDSINHLPRTVEVFEVIDQEPDLSHHLPRAGSSAGRVLQHAVNVFEGLLARHKPMTFKFGITNDPYKRWHSKTYGYKNGRDKFEAMIIIYAANNPYGPAFLEAALVDRFGSTLAAHHIFFTIGESMCVCAMSICFSSVRMIDCLTFFF